MALNATLLGVWIVGFEQPAWLLFYNHYSIGVHFAAALNGVSAVRDSDAVVENRMLELKAETARQDLITGRKVTAIGSPLVIVFAHLCDWRLAKPWLLHELDGRTGYDT